MAGDDPFPRDRPGEALFHEGLAHVRARNYAFAADSFCCFNNSVKITRRTCGGLMRSGRSAGYALVMALLLLVLASLSVMVAVQKAQTEAQRERETELLFVGNQFRQALRAYATAPGLPSEFPETLEDLLLDKRWPVPRRYLRTIYPDPITGKPDWQLDRMQGRIVGVHSSSDRAPLRHAGFSLENASFEKADTYADWRFSAAGRARGPMQPGPGPDAFGGLPGASATPGGRP